MDANSTEASLEKLKLASTDGDSKPAESTDAADTDLVTPWEVSAASLKGVDYDKLIDKFGVSRLDPELLARFAKVIGRDVHHMIRRGIFFAHRHAFYPLLMKCFENARTIFIYIFGNDAETCNRFWTSARKASPSSCTRAAGRAARRCISGISSLSS